MKKGTRWRRNRIGEKYGRLMIIGDDLDTVGTDRRVIVRCDCGIVKKIRLSNLHSANTMSCGCLQREVIARLTEHGMDGSPTYSSWRSARGRCRNPRHTNFAEYGGKGICFSDRWNHFEDFLEDMGIRPGLGYTLDRIDPEGHYQPGNCQWAERSMQRRNQARKPKEEFSRFKGVHKFQGKYRAMISVHNRTIDLGCFSKEISAAKAYDKAAVRYHGERAVTNAMLGRF